MKLYKIFKLDKPLYMLGGDYLEFAKDRANIKVTLKHQMDFTHIAIVFDNDMIGQIFGNENLESQLLDKGFVYNEL